MDYNKLSATQTHVFHELCKFIWNKSDLYYILSGTAGSGKTSIISVLNSVFKTNISFTHSGLNYSGCSLRIKCMALTGKAVSVMISKGITASTIHSLFYQPIFENDEIVGWDKKPVHKNDYDLFIIDEASMLSEDIIHDILDIGVPTIFVGDRNQLPPISGNLNVMESPDIHIDEIHRVAAGNPIIQLSQDILKRGVIHNSFHDGEFINIINTGRLGQKFFDNNPFDTVIVGTNKMRKKTNTKVRNSMGFTDEIPKSGETIMCLRNNPIKGIQNGARYKVLDVSGASGGKRLFHITDGDSKFDVIIQDTSWEEIVPHRDESEYFTYGYAMTAHKSQGSEFDNLLMVDENVSYFLDSVKFRYTGVTRAKNNITIFKGRP